MRTEDVSDDSRKRRDDGDDEEERENRARPNKNGEKATSSYYGSSGSSHSGYHNPDPMSPGGVYGGVKGDGCVGKCLIIKYRLSNTVQIIYDLY